MYEKKIIVLFAAIFLVVGLAGGAVAGYYYHQKVAKCATGTASTVDATTGDMASTVATATGDTSAELVSCLKAKWGESKYLTITANPSIATVDDKFNALPCYK